MERKIVALDNLEYFYEKIQNEIPTRLSEIENDVNYITDGFDDGVYGVSPTGELLNIDLADSNCVGVALVQGSHTFMIEKSEDYSASTDIYLWDNNHTDTAIPNFIKVGGGSTSSYGYLKLDGTGLNIDYNTWDEGTALGDFNGKSNSEVLKTLTGSDKNIGYCLNDFNNGNHGNNQGFSDWYIPSCGQMGLIIVYAEAINAMMLKIGGSEFVKTSYWTSSEYAQNDAWYVNFWNNSVGMYSSNKDDYTEFRVRFIRDIKVLRSFEKINDLVASLDEKKQNTINDLETIRQGAAKGATALQSHQDISHLATKTELSNGLASKVDVVSGKGLSTNDYTTTEKDKLSGIEAGAEVNVQSDWNTSDTSADSYIKNKPNLSAVATSGSYNDLSNKPTIPSAVTESTVSGWGFTKNTGTYTKPSTGIPKGDLASDVQGSLSKADTALQAVPGEYVTETELTNKGYATTSAMNTALGNKVDKVSGKQLSTEDFTTALKNKLNGLSNYDDTTINNAISGLQAQINTLVSGNANTAIESFNEIIAFLDGIEDSQSLDSIIASIEQQIAAKYTKPSTGIPKSDLASDVQTSLGKADTALQSYNEKYTGTITEIKMNGASKGTSGVVDLGAVITDVSNKQDKGLKFTNLTASSWVDDTTYGDYPYRCDLACSGVTADMYAEVVFDIEQATGGNYAPVCDTKTNIVSIWGKVNDSITVPTIIITK